MIDIKRGIVALALVSAGVLALSGCNAATIAEDVAPIAAGESPLPEMHEDAPPFEEEGEPMDEMDKVAVAGKESYTFEDGLSISIGNLRKGKVPPMVIDRQVGKQHGTGKKSEMRNQSPHWATSALMTSGLVSRWRGSKLGMRPARVTGWNTTPRTAGWARPWRMMAPTWSRFVSASTAATSSTAKPVCAHRSRALAFTARRSRPRKARCVEASRPSNCR